MRESYKRIDLLKVSNVNNEIQYSEENNLSKLYLKTPIINTTGVTIDEHKNIKYIPDRNNSRDLQLLEILFQISAKFDEHTNKMLFLDNQDRIIFYISTDTKYFNSNTYEISENKLEDSNKCLCYIYFKDSKIYIDQYMKI